MTPEGRTRPNEGRKFTRRAAKKTLAPPSTFVQYCFAKAACRYYIVLQGDMKEWMS